MIRPAGRPRPPRRRSLQPLPAIVLLAAALAVLACAGEDAPPPDAAALLAGEAVRYDEFRAYLDRDLGESGSGLDSPVLSQLFDQFLEERLLTRLATERGLVPEGSPPRRAAAALLSAPAEAGGVVSDEEVERYFRRHRDDLSRPARVRLFQILVEDEDQANAAAAALAAGEDFGEVARRMSEDPGAAEGGYQGVLTHGELPLAFADTIFELTPGQPSDVIAADYGHHIFLVTERLPPERPTLEVAAPRIRELLARQQREEHLSRLVTEAQERYNLRVYERNLPFSYQGRYGTDTTL